MPTRAELEAREAAALAPYAMRSRDSRGRRHPEPEHPLRMVFQRDRDRIIHSTAFRRLEYKTQVFVNHEGDYYRTRLTHTIEAAQVTRTLARALGLNEDLAEAVALAHDLGHTPFGHAGERTLDRLMKPHGGFDHNSQSLRIVDLLEDRYPAFRGLNLSWEVREGIVKHSTRYDRPQVREFDPELAPSLEALEERSAAVLRCGLGGWSRVSESLLGIIQGSQYVKRPTAQEQSLFKGERSRYLVVYPFTKSAEWYLLDKETRQRVMNEHMKVGHSYPKVRQLLANSFGVDDMDFLVAYETDDLAEFGNLVRELRGTESRRSTVRDTPILTAVHRDFDDLTRLLGA